MNGTRMESAKRQYARLAPLIGSYLVRLSPQAVSQPKYTLPAAGFPLLHNRYTKLLHNIDATQVNTAVRKHLDPNRAQYRTLRNFPALSLAKQKLSALLEKSASGSTPPTAGESASSKCIAWRIDWPSSLNSNIQKMNPKKLSVPYPTLFRYQIAVRKNRQSTMFWERTGNGVKAKAISSFNPSNKFGLNYRQQNASIPLFREGFTSCP